MLFIVEMLRGSTPLMWATLARLLSWKKPRDFRRWNDSVWDIKKKRSLMNMKQTNRSNWLSLLSSSVLDYDVLQVGSGSKSKHCVQWNYPDPSWRLTQPNTAGEGRSCNEGHTQTNTSYIIQTQVFYCHIWSLFVCSVAVLWEPHTSLKSSSV